jgi:hypothetical protein
MQKGKLFNNGGLEKGAVTQNLWVYKLKNIYNADQTGLFFRIPPNKTVSLEDNSCHYGKNSQREWGSYTPVFNYWVQYKSSLL